MSILTKHINKTTPLSNMTCLSTEMTTAESGVNLDGDQTKISKQQKT